MNPLFKSPRDQRLFTAFSLGKTVRDAAVDAGCSEPTARKFRDKNAASISKVQQATTSGVLGSLTKLLPEGVETYSFLLKNPTTPALRESVAVVRAIFSAYETMRDVDFEARLIAIEKRLEEANKGASATADNKSEKPGC